MVGVHEVHLKMHLRPWSFDSHKGKRGAVGVYGVAGVWGADTSGIDGGGA